MQTMVMVVLLNIIGLDMIILLTQFLVEGDNMLQLLYEFSLSILTFVAPFVYCGNLIYFLYVVIIN